MKELMFFLMGVATPAFARYLATGARDPEPPRAELYDWAADSGLLDIWAFDAEGEVLAVYPDPTGTFYQWFGEPFEGGEVP